MYGIEHKLQHRKTFGNLRNGVKNFPALVTDNDAEFKYEICAVQ